MIKAIFVIALLIVVGGGVYYAGTKHFVKTSDGIKTYDKDGFTLSDTYVDMTDMSFIELRNHVDVVEVMASEGDLEYVPGGTTLTKIARAGENVIDAVNTFDDEYQISKSLDDMENLGREKYRELDKEYDITRKAKRAERIGREKYRELDKEYDISGNAERIGKDVSDGVNKWLSGK